MERQRRTAEKVILAGQMNRFLRTDVKCCCATGKLSCSRPYFYESHAKVQTDKRDFI